MVTFDSKLGALRDSKTRAYLACTGAGAGLQQMLWAVPGISSFLVGAEFPYDPAATERFLGFRPEKFCSRATAVDMATEAYARALAGGEGSAIGLGLTASVATKTEHRGDHRIHAAAACSSGVWAADWTISKGVGAATREVDGRLADELGLQLLLHASLVESIFDGGLPDGLVVEEVTAQARAQFLARSYFARDDKRFCGLPASVRGVLFPGAFNPPHVGHFRIAEEVPDRGPVVFHVTVDPPHKPALSFTEMVERAARLRGRDRMLTEGDALYLDKARRFPGRAIVIGADALARMFDPCWGQPVEPMLAEFQSLGTRFFVVGRLVDGQFRSPDDVRALVPEPFRALFQPLAGRWDISSSQIRAAAQVRA